MSSGSSAHDGDGGWPSARNPYRDDAMSGPGPSGPGRRSEPREVPGGRRETQFGPDISWPNGFRQLDSESRRLLESGYGRNAFDHADPGYGTGGRGAASRAPAADDYGDPGYSDPRYDAPGGEARGSRAPGGAPVSGGSGYGSVPGYQLPDYREPARPDYGYQHDYPGPGLYSAPDVYPVTGAQEALPATGPQPAADSWTGRAGSTAPSRRPAYPEQWYGHPRMDDSRRAAARPDSRPASDPRLAGMRYDELRYDELRYDELRYDEPAAGGPGYDEPLDDESWVQELRRSEAAFPPPPGGPAGPDQRRGDSRGPGYGQPQAGWGQQGGPSQPGYPQAFGYGQGRDDRGGSAPVAPRGPRMSAAPQSSPLAAPRPVADPRDSALSAGTYYGAPTAQVGVLTPPSISRLEDPLDTGPQPVTPAAAVGRTVVFNPQVRPGHGLDGPEITSSWPAQPQVDEAESFEEFWAEDDADADYGGLFPDEDAIARRKSARAKADPRRIGRRRGRSNDHRLWLALLGVLVLAGGAIFGVLKLEFPSHGGPIHKMVTPAKIGSYLRTLNMEKETKLDSLRQEVIKMSAGQASNVQSAVYESGNSAAGNTEQIVMYIGGHLANAAPASSITSFTQKFAGAFVSSAGPLGGKAACVEEAPGTANSVAMCVWFDNDSFGEIVSPTMTAKTLAGVLRTMRPSLELVVKK
jgi:predicted lipid-binding transport protein (Tim44 family)